MSEPQDLLARGFEQGPIRPPSEAFSLLLRVTRNCPWNKCKFCPVYKTENFSRRELGEVLADIDAMAAWQEELKARSWRLGFGGSFEPPALQSIYQHEPDNPFLYALVLFWLGQGRTAFLQDADSLAVKSEHLVQILKHLRQKFPSLTRVTSYGRTRTLARKNLEELLQIRQAGLDRIHIGMESGSDQVLELMSKGATQAEQIEAGKKVKQAGLELSEYYMPGLGGKKFSEEHARETAKALNQINPDFIRLRSLAIPPRAPLYEMFRAGQFVPLNDVEMVKEVRLFIEHLEGITSYFVSDHMLNLLPELEGKFPEEKARLLSLCDRFISLPESDQLDYIIGRRAGLLETLDELARPELKARAEAVRQRLEVQTIDQAQEIISKLMESFI